MNRDKYDNIWGCPQRNKMSYNYGNDENNHIDLSDPWYKNEALVSCLLFFVLLAVGMAIIAMIPS